jgi:hypothetical protein
LKSILSSGDEKILYREILGYKIKPDKNALFASFQANWRYLMFTNKKLYTMDPKPFDEGSIDESKLIKNRIDLDYLSHIIFFPKFEFSTFECLNVSKLNSSMIDDFKKRQVDVILGFMDDSNS